MLNPQTATSFERRRDDVEQVLDAYRAAFDDLELDWHWDRNAIEELRRGGEERSALRSLLRSRHTHLLSVYDEDFLVDAILAAKRRHALI